MDTSFLELLGLQIERRVVEFDNGYSASIIRGPHTYGGSEGLYEIAVLHNDRIVYDTPVTDDVIGWLDDAGVAEVLGQIGALPPR